MGRFSAIRKDLLACLLLAGLAFALALPFLGDGAFLSRHSARRDLPWSRTADHDWARDEPLNHVFSDSVNLLWPDLAFARRSAAESGLVTAWNPEVFCGVPHAANPLTASFYPPTLLLRSQDPLDALALHAALHLFLLGTFVLVFLRVAGLGTRAALFGAVGAALSGWVAAHLQNVQLVAVMAWVPLGLAGIEGRLRGRGPWCEAALALALAFSWLAGFPQLAFLGTLTLGLYALVGLLAGLRAHAPRAQAGRATLLLLAALIGLGLAAPQILPSRALSEEAEHFGRELGDLEGDRLRPPVLIGAVLPRMLGDPMHFSDWREHWGARILLGEPEARGVLPPAAVGWGERTLYPGLLVLPLAFLGLLAARRRQGVALLLIAGFGALAALSTDAIGALHVLPGFNFGAPSRAIALPCLVLPLLAAFGLQRWLDTSGTSPMGRGLRWLIALVAALCALLATAAWLFEDDVLLQLIEMLKSAGVERRFGVTEPRPAADYLEAMRPAFRDLRLDLGLFALFAGAGTALFWWAGRSAVPRTRFATLAILLLTVDLLAFMIPPNLPVTRRALFTETPALKWLAARRDEGRILRVARDEATALREADSLLVPNLGLLYGLSDVQGWRELVSRDYLALWEGVSAKVAPVGFAAVPVERLRAPIVALARARFLVASEPLPALEAFRAYPAAGSSGELYVYDNPQILTPAWIVHAAHMTASAADARVSLAEEGLDLQRTVILETPEGAAPELATPPEDAEEEATILVRHPERLEIRCRAATRGLLVIPEAWDPGWGARLGPEGAADDELEDVPLRRANAGFRAVPVPAGTSRVVLTYAPREITHGFLVAAGGVLALLGLIAWSWRRGRQPLPATPSETEARHEA